MMKNGAHVLLLNRHRPRQVFGRHRQPGPAFAEAAIRLVRVPDHRRAAPVAALEVRPELDAIGILQILESQLGLRQGQFFALIDADRAAQRHQEAREEFRMGIVIGDILAPARDMANDIMVGKGPAGPAFRRGPFEGVLDFRPRAGVSGSGARNSKA